MSFAWKDDFIEPEDREPWLDEDVCPGCELVDCECDVIYDEDDDHGPLDSDFGDSEADHVWADLRRSEAE